ncbi:hypothetical protein [Candidatus Bathycorpusculum sp.]|jgi:hypothetical protein|uniref:hypothetical protein n=1 Tax=Candidatus Bathycorpusculum sp. TaxID=2994959 RepID=UPI00283136BD|nr:hypothetical protein [Candidatus Termitimicrobium sp.]MDR2708026.1 hypothetical protein [Nitrososphaerota archaeon]
MRESKFIEEIHKIREKHYEETKDLPLEEKLERIKQGSLEFQKLVEQARKEQKGSIEVAQPV